MTNNQTTAVTAGPLSKALDTSSNLLLTYFCWVREFILKQNRIAMQPIECKTRRVQLHNNTIHTNMPIINTQRYDTNLNILKQKNGCSVVKVPRFRTWLGPWTRPLSHGGLKTIMFNHICKSLWIKVTAKCWKCKSEEVFFTDGD